MDLAQAAPLWKVLTALEHQAMHEWWTEHAPHQEQEVALAEHVRTVETTLVRKHGGNITVTVSFICNRPTMNSVEFFSLQRAGNHLYKLLITA